MSEQWTVRGILSLDSRGYAVRNGTRSIAACPTREDAEQIVRNHTERADLTVEIDRLKVEVAHWRTMAEQHASERDAFRRTLADLLGMHPAASVAPAERPGECPTE